MKTIQICSMKFLKIPYFCFCEIAAFEHCTEFAEELITLKEETRNLTAPDISKERNYLGIFSLGTRGSCMVIKWQVEKILGYHIS